MVYALRTGTVVVKQNAAYTLLSLSMIEENRGAIGAYGAIPPQVSLLVSGSSRGKKDSLTTLYKLCSVRRNKERAFNAGAVPPLVGLVGERGGGTAEKALVVLGSLVAVPEGKDAVAMLSRLYMNPITGGSGRDPGAGRGNGNRECERIKEMASAALAYKCIEVAYLKAAYCKNPNARRDRHELQAVFQFLPPDLEVWHFQ